MGKVLNFEEGGSILNGLEGNYGLELRPSRCEVPGGGNDNSNSDSGEDDGCLMPLGRLRCIVTPRELVCYRRTVTGRLKRAGSWRQNRRC